MKGYKHLTPEQRQAILASYAETHSTVATAALLGVSGEQVRHLLKRNGIALSGMQGGVCYQRDQELRQWSADGISLSEIARRLGTNNRIARKYIQDYNLDRKPFRQAMENNPFWRGGRVIDQDGYVLVKKNDHPRADRHGYVREHRLVMEQQLGRPLDSKEVVHHLDGNRQNNHPSNLSLFPSNGQHLAHSRKGLAPNISPEGWDRIRESTRQMNRRRAEASHAASKPDGQPSL